MSTRKRFAVLIGAALSLILLGGVFAMSFVFDPQRFADGFIRMQNFDLLDTTVDMNLLQASSGLSQNYDPIVKSTDALRTALEGIHAEEEGEGEAYTLPLQTLIEKAEQKLLLIERYKSLNSTMKNSLNFLAGSPLEKLFARVQYHVTFPDLQSRESVEELVGDLGRKQPSLSRDEIRSLRDHALFLLDNAPVRRDLLQQITALPTHELARKLNGKYGDDFMLMQQRLGLSRRLLFVMSTILIGAIAYLLLAQEQLITHQTRSLRQQTVEIQSNLDRLKEAQSQLLQSSKLSALGEMAGGVAHEINNPISVIMLMADEIRDLGDAPADRAELGRALDKITSTAKRIATIVAGLRTFSRDGTRDPAEFFPVETMITETLSFCAERFKSHGIRLEVLPFDRALQVEGRRIQLSQVLLNLLNNAYDAIDGTASPWVRVEVNLVDGHLRLSVTDSGSGLSPETEAKVFEPFFTTKQVGKGTGLGLSISRGIVESHRGRLFVDHGLSHTCFVVELPGARMIDAQAA